MEIKVTLVVAVGALVLSLLAWLCSSEVFSFLLRPPGKKKREIMAGSIWQQRLQVKKFFVFLFQAWCAGREEQRCCPLAQRVGRGGRSSAAPSCSRLFYLVGKGLNLGCRCGCGRGRSGSASVQLWLCLQQWWEWWWCGRAPSLQSASKLGDSGASCASLRRGWCPLRLGQKTWGPANST